jgi:hypothetical protein
VQTVYTDGAYQSKENRKFAEDNGIEFIANGIPGKPSRFDLDMTDEHTLQVTDKTTAEVQTAKPVKQDQIPHKDKAYFASHRKVCLDQHAPTFLV